MIAKEDRTKCEIWTRVMGYHRPVTSWNKGKQQEFKDRTYFKENASNTTRVHTKPGVSDS